MTEPIHQDETQARRGTAVVSGWLFLVNCLLIIAVFAAAGAMLVIYRERSAPTPQDGAALKVMKSQVLRDPSVDSRLELASRYQLEGNYRAAASQYSAALKMEPGNIGALYNLGLLRLEQGRDEEAETLLTKVLKMRPAHPMASKALAELYLSRSDYRATLDVVDPVVERNPQLADIQYIQGRAYEGLGKVDAAQASYRRALKYDPQLAEAREGLDHTSEAAQ